MIGQAAEHVCEPNGYTPFENAVQREIADLVPIELARPISTRIGSLYRAAIQQSGQVLICTVCWAKPIPMRQFDWEAVRDGYEGGDPLGLGATEEEAIADLLEQETSWTSDDVKRLAGGIYTDTMLTI
jgi:hypothetical protein